MYITAFHSLGELMLCVLLEDKVWIRLEYICRIVTEDQNHIVGDLTVGMGLPNATLPELLADKYE
jgi:hypothetical protein